MNPTPPIATPRLSLTMMTMSDAADMHDIRGREEVMKWSVKKVPDATPEVTTNWLQRFTSDELSDDLGPRVGYVIRELSLSPSITPSASSSSSSSSSSTSTSTSTPPTPSPSSSPSTPPATSIPEGKVIGMLGIRLEAHTSPWAPAGQKASGKDRWEIGYILHPLAWGKGYASEAVKGVIGAWEGGVRDDVGLKEKYVRARGGQEEAAAAVDGGVWAMVNSENGASQKVLTKCRFEGPVEVEVEEDGRVGWVFVKN
ncbi:hypothetical protein BO71DRAFT_483428 [Aspergillus ellipticus CBS 707.79]|uniref:N-acetyltransferase domain-containing protein n=1 Tax=Aspergillus ellipticus CBS 707.79 TaxID=1448320 RepID=A0A319DBM5_9EURO|nr:hypothetical protein BO71DRAFT_483428 [Aspergillus ellipticus CBS 707.79]